MSGIFKTRRPPKVGRRDCDRQEKRAAAGVGGKVTRGSGNGATKGDIRAPGLLLECKTRIALPVGWTTVLQKTAREAMEAGVVPAVEVEARDGALDVPWTMIPSTVFHAMYQAWRRENDG